MSKILDCGKASVHQCLVYAEVVLLLILRSFNELQQNSDAGGLCAAVQLAEGHSLALQAAVREQVRRAVGNIEQYWLASSHLTLYSVTRCSLTVRRRQHGVRCMASAVLLEVKGLRAKVAATGQEILKGVDLVVREGEVRAASFTRSRCRGASSREVLLPLSRPAVIPGAGLRTCIARRCVAWLSVNSLCRDWLCRHMLSWEQMGRGSRLCQSAWLATQTIRSPLAQVRYLLTSTRTG